MIPQAFYLQVAASQRQLLENLDVLTVANSAKRLFREGRNMMDGYEKGSAKVGFAGSHQHCLCLLLTKEVVFLFPVDHCRQKGSDSRIFFRNG